MPVWTWFGLQKGRATTSWPEHPGADGQQGVLGLPRFDAARCTGERPQAAALQRLPTEGDEKTWGGPAFSHEQGGCSDCVAACPAAAITRNEAGAVQLDYARCVGCQICTEVCPQGAFTVSHDWAFGVRDKADLVNLGCGQDSPPQPSPPGGEGEKRASPTSWGRAGGASESDAKRSSHLPHLWGRAGGGEANTAALEQQLKGFGRSLHIRHVDAGSCNGCESELQALLNPFYNLHRLGIFFTPSPRFADLLLVTGPVTAAMREPLLRTYEAMPQPRWVMAAGTCATGGGTNGGGYACHHGLEGILPVDVWLPGCPPNPAALIDALLLLLRRRPQRVHGGLHESA
ncbi:NADH-quinone oxidoreductase subunit NuoB [Thiomonas sp.]